MKTSVFLTRWELIFLFHSRRPSTTVFNSKFLAPTSLLYVENSRLGLPPFFFKRSIPAFRCFFLQSNTNRLIFSTHFHFGFQKLHAISSVVFPLFHLLRLTYHL